MQKVKMNALVGLDNKEEKRAIEGNGSHSKTVRTGNTINLLLVTVMFFIFFSSNSYSEEDWRKKYFLVGEFINGYAIIYGGNLYYEDGDFAGRGRYGFVDSTGKEISGRFYALVDNFSEGRARVNKGAVLFKYNLIDSGKWGFIDTTGKEVIPTIYDWAWNFTEGLAGVKKDGKWGYIDKTGYKKIPLQYDNAMPFSEGMAAVFTTIENINSWGFIDTTGKQIIPYIYEDIRYDENYKVQVRQGEEWFYINTKGERVE